MKTSELQGAALDWAVKQIEDGRTDGIRNYSPSTNWALAGPIIERERIEVSDYGGDEWLATDNLHTSKQGETFLIAAMRCYVASKLGDEVEIPEGLK